MQAFLRFCISLALARKALVNDAATGAVSAAEAAKCERLVAVGNEIRLSFERTVGAGAKDVDALLKRLGATPEQESTIRAAIQETYVTTFGKPTRAQQVAGFMKIYAALDGEQRKELAKYIGEQRGDPNAGPADQQNSK